jgi:hypothetical protein
MMSDETHVPPSLPPLTTEYEGPWAPDPIWTVCTTEQFFDRGRNRNELQFIGVQTVA